jgi:ornithine cyclodeaminase
MIRELPFDLVDGRAVHEIVTSSPARCMDIVEEAYRRHSAGAAVCPPSLFLLPPESPGCRVIALPAALGDGRPAGIKWIASYPSNLASGLTRASAVIILNSPETGFPFALLEGSVISAARTAASAVLAAKRINDKRHVRTLGIIGTGLIARWVYRFLIGTGWTIERVRLFDNDINQADRFAEMETSADPERDVVVDTSKERTLSCSDLILFTTVAREPHVHDPDLFSHAPLVLHLSLRDLAPEIVLAATNVVDDRTHVLTASTSLHLAHQKTGDDSFIHGDMMDLLAGAVSFESGKPVVFSPFGLGALDIAVAAWIHEEARSRRASRTIPDFFGDAHLR